MSNRSLTWHQSLTVDLIASPCHVFKPTDAVSSALKLMEEYNWDFAGYSGAGTDNADAVVSRSELAKPTCTAMQHACEGLDIGLLVAEQTPILEALPRLVENERLYVFGKGGVNRLVTLADLDKQQVRLLIFGLISSLEVRFMEWIREHCVTSGNLPDWLNQDRIEDAEKILRLRKEKNEDTDLLDCLTFIDKANLIQKIKIESLLEPYGRSKWSTYFDRMQRARNALAHAMPLSEHVEWSKTVHFLGLIQSMLAVPLPSER